MSSVVTLFAPYHSLCLCCCANVVHVFNAPTYVQSHCCVFLFEDRFFFSHDNGCPVLSFDPILTSLLCDHMCPYITNPIVFVFPTLYQLQRSHYECWWRPLCVGYEYLWGKFKVHQMIHSGSWRRPSQCFVCSWGQSIGTTFNPTSVCKTSIKNPLLFWSHVSQWIGVLPAVCLTSY